MLFGQNLNEWKEIKRIYKPGTLIKNHNPIHVRVFEGDGHEEFRYEVMDSDSIFMLYKPPRIETEDAMMSVIVLEMLCGEDMVQFLCYMSPWELFDVLSERNEEQ